MQAWQLTVDLGTRSTKAARSLAGVAEPVALAGRPELPSAVFLHRDGSLRAGWEAWDRGAVAPERLEPTPRRWLSNGSTLVLGGTVLPVVDALEAVLACAVEQATAVMEGAPSELALSFPAGWPASRTALLEEAAGRIAVPLAGLVPEPVAAVEGALPGLAPGATVAVYDLGAGTLGTAVVRQTERGPRLVGRPGGHERMGGDVFDERLLRHIGSRLAVAEPGSWDELDAGTELRWQRARLSLRIQLRQAREQLSTQTSTQVAVPMTGRSLPITRDELESLVAREVEQAAEALHRSVVEAGVDPATLDHVLVVGGTSRMPLVQWSLLTRFGERVLFAPEPERVVALGAARLLGSEMFVRPATSIRPGHGGVGVVAPPGGAPVAPVGPAFEAAPATAPPPIDVPAPAPPPVPPVADVPRLPSEAPAAPAPPGAAPPPPVAVPPPVPVGAAHAPTDRLLLVLIVALAAALGVAVALLVVT